jgi:LDH2 family malate/lactate/ureidoglycolate dehydrogenase
MAGFAVEEFQPLDEFTGKVDELISFVKSRKPAPGFSEVFLPGEHGRKHEARQRKEGVEINDGTWTELSDLAVKLGLEFTQPI